MVDEQRVFYANMCFICHLTLREVELKLCSSCKLVSYCSKSHQRKHWKAHKEFCRVTQIAEKNLSDTNVNIENWYKYRINVMILCEIKLGRKLMHHEMNMILFPSNCHVCHKRTNLKPCWNCLSVNYCSDDHKNEDSYNHTSICELFSLCCKTDLYQEKTTLYPAYDVRQDDLVLTDDIKKFIETNLILERNIVSKEIEEALLSEILTCPLTLMYALNKLGYSFPEYAVIHLVGSSMLETAILCSWDIILDIQKHVKEMVIHFIGPDAKKLMDLALIYEGKLKFKFSDKFYHDFVKSKTYEKPDVICAFNCGFHEFEGTQSDTWKNSLPFLIENDQLPLIFTSFTKDEVDQDMKQLLMIKSNLNAETELNPFSSLRPYRDPENLGVYFNNKYLTTVRQTT